jgi:glycine dehydrogenase subunit 1
MRYIGIDPDSRDMMLKTIGVSSIDELFSDLPASVKMNEIKGLPDPLSEMELFSRMKNIESENRSPVIFAGGGCYSHYIPSAVDRLASRSEFFTAYTPYQPEVSQGTLTAIFEYQTMISDLTGMDISNAGMYDGATALAESVFMASRSSGRNHVLISRAVHPAYREVLRTYAWASDITLTEIPCIGGLTSLDECASGITPDTSAVVIQFPNYFGTLEDISSFSEMLHGKGIFLIVVVNEPLALALLKPPGSCGADIVCGEASSFGNPLAFGGPMLGFIAAREQFLRKMPGRLVGRTVDADGKTAYALTLQTREQHIRREKATSNICSNEALVALRAVIYLSYMGPRLKELAELNHSLASYMMKKLSDKGFETVFDRPFFNEFIVKYHDAENLRIRLRENGYLAGINLGDHYPELKDCLLLCATEMNTAGQIDSFVDDIERLV